MFAVVTFEISDVWTYISMSKELSKNVKAYLKLKNSGEQEKESIISVRVG